MGFIAQVVFIARLNNLTLNSDLEKGIIKTYYLLLFLLLLLDIYIVPIFISISCHSKVLYRARKENYLGKCKN